ncbi:MAG: hypothetical protein ACP5LF_05705 [Nitrososphaeria archaeon]|nr:hypothetical protein [Conexivisphaerales archaeon]
MSSEELEKLAELRSKIEEKLEELKEEENFYNDLLNVIDSILKKESFVKAVQMPIEGKKEEETEVRDLKRPKDGQLLGQIFITKDSAVIKPNPELNLKAETPPFRSFFVNKILEQMKQKDREEESSGTIEEGKTFDYSLEIKDGVIQQIVIKNYRTQTRLNEIIHAAIWTFSRMLERSSQTQ